MTFLLWIAYIVGGVIGLFILFLIWLGLWGRFGTGRFLLSASDAIDRYKELDKASQHWTKEDAWKALEELQEIRSSLAWFYKESWLAKILPWLRAAVAAKQREVEFEIWGVRKVLEKQA